MPPDLNLAYRCCLHFRHNLLDTLDLPDVAEEEEEFYKLLPANKAIFIFRV